MSTQYRRGYNWLDTITEIKKKPIPKGTENFKKMLQAFLCHEDLFIAKASETEIEIKGTNLGNHCPLGHIGCCWHDCQIYSGQSCEQHQREDLSALPILERCAQGLSVQGLALRNTFQFCG